MEFGIPKLWSSKWLVCLTQAVANKLSHDWEQQNRQTAQFRQRKLFCISQNQAKQKHQCNFYIMNMVWDFLVTGIYFVFLTQKNCKDDLETLPLPN